MLDLEELRQLAAFADLGTLNRVAEEFHISTPSITRSMQHLEEIFGVSLFIRRKNRIELSETGRVAVEAARELLRGEEMALRRVRDFDARRRTVVIRSCAPAPLWELQRRLNTQHPGLTLSSAICQNDEVLSAWQEKTCDIAILPFPIDGAVPFMKENLFVCVPSGHQLSNSETLTFADINGFNFLLRTELGFWDTLCREKMPASKFLVQPDAFAFEELVKSSSLPCFTTDYGHFSSHSDRVRIPLSDPEAQVTFYLATAASVAKKT